MDASDRLSESGRDVYRFDRDRFQTVFFAPPDRREALFVLYAFNAEIARVLEQGAEPVLGLIRLQWWRDTLEAHYASGAVLSHPAGQLLGGIIRQYQLPRQLLTGIIEARQAELEQNFPAELPGFEDCIAGAAANLAQLALHILGVSDQAAHQAARSAGLAWGLTGVLRNLPFRMRDGLLTLPQDLLDQQGLTAEQVLEGKGQQGLTRIAAILAGRAEKHIVAARDRRADVPKAALPVLMQATLADCYLKKLRADGCNLFSLDWSRPRPRPLRLTFNTLLRRY